MNSRIRVTTCQGDNLRLFRDLVLIIVNYLTKNTKYLLVFKYKTLGYLYSTMTIYLSDL